MISSQRPWPLDHEAGRNCEVKHKKKYVFKIGKG